MSIGMGDTCDLVVVGGPAGQSPEPTRACQCARSHLTCRNGFFVALSIPSLINMVYQPYCQNNPTKDTNAWAYRSSKILRLELIWYLRLKTKYYLPTSWISPLCSPPPDFFWHFGYTIWSGYKGLLDFSTTLRCIGLAWFKFELLKMLNSRDFQTRDRIPTINC